MPVAATLRVLRHGPRRLLRSRTASLRRMSAHSAAPAREHAARLGGSRVLADKKSGKRRSMRRKLAAVKGTRCEEARGAVAVSRSESGCRAVHARRRSRRAAGKRPEGAGPAVGTPALRVAAPPSALALARGARSARGASASGLNLHAPKVPRALLRSTSCGLQSGFAAS